MNEDFLVIFVGIVVIVLLAGCAGEQIEMPDVHTASLAEDVSILSHSNQPYQLEKGLAVTVIQCFDDGYATIYFPYKINLPNNMHTEGNDSGIVKQSQLSQGACDW